MGCICQTQVITKITETKAESQIRLFKAACVSICCMAAIHGYLQRHLTRNLKSLQGHTTGLWWRSNNRETMKQTRDYINELTKCQCAKWFASVSSSSQVTVFACIPTSPSIALINQLHQLQAHDSKVRPSLRPRALTKTCRQQITSHLLPGEKALVATEIWKIALNKSVWNKQFVVSKKKKPQDLSTELEWWWWWGRRKSVTSSLGGFA